NVVVVERLAELHGERLAFAAIDQGAAGHEVDLDVLEAQRLIHEARADEDLAAELAAGGGTADLPGEVDGGARIGREGVAAGRIEREVPLLPVPRHVHVGDDVVLGDALRIEPDAVGTLGVGPGRDAGEVLQRVVGVHLDVRQWLAREVPRHPLHHEGGDLPGVLIVARLRRVPSAGAGSQKNQAQQEGGKGRGGQGRAGGRQVHENLGRALRQGGGRVRVLPGIQATRSGTRRTVRYLSAEGSAGGDLDQHHA